MVNTTKKRTTELEKGIAAALAAYLAAYPDPMSRTDFRKACHISTRISIYPTAERPGALQQYRQAHPLLSPNHKPPANALVRRLDLTAPRRKKLRSRLAKQLVKAPDVLTLQQTCDITGYNRHTVSRWCTEGRLKPIMKTPTFRAPKVWLLDFLCSDDYNNICRKSRKHNQMVREMQEL